MSRARTPSSRSAPIPSSRPLKLLVDGNGSKIRLTEKETSILKYLIGAGERVVTRDVLLHEVWGYNALNHHAYARDAYLLPAPEDREHLSRRWSCSSPRPAAISWYLDVDSPSPLLGRRAVRAGWGLSGMTPTPTPPFGRGSLHHKIRNDRHGARCAANREPDRGRAWTWRRRRARASSRCDRDACLRLTCASRGCDSSTR